MRLLHELPIVDIQVEYLGRTLRLENILLDTGSAGTVLDADVVSQIGINLKERTEQPSYTALVGPRLYSLKC